MDARTFLPDHGERRLTSAIVSDALDSVGRRHQVFDACIRPNVAGTHAFGRAVTLQFAPTATESERPYDDAIEFIDGLHFGAVAVIATDRSDRSAFWGELFSAAAQGRGAAGVVTDGYLRDSPKIAGLGFPAFSRGCRPIDYRARMRVVSRNQPVVVAGVKVSPGDLLLGDDDGIVVVPQVVEEEVMAHARMRATAETTVLQELLNGDGLRVVWDRHGIL